MAFETTPATANSCDGTDHVLPPNRAVPLSHDAQNFNQILRTNEVDGTGTGTGNDQKVEDAGQAFYEELVQLPIGERKALLSMAEASNKIFAAGDPAMPTIEATIDPDAYLEQLTINYPLPFNPDLDSRHREHDHGKAKEYIAEDFVYQGWGMCAQAEPPGPYSFGYSPYQGDWNGQPILSLFKSRRLRKFR